MAKISPMLSTLRAARRTPLRFGEQRPNWANKLDNGPGPGAYRQFSGFGYMDFKHRPSVLVQSERPKLS